MGEDGLGAVLVNPEILRAFADQADAASAKIRATDIGRTAATAGASVSSSSTQWATGLVGEHFAQIAATIAENVRDMGMAVRGAGDRFEVADDALASDFDGLF
jgi:uncharacterized protein YukE